MSRGIATLEGITPRWNGFLDEENNFWTGTPELSVRSHVYKKYSNHCNVSSIENAEIEIFLMIIELLFATLPYILLQ